MILLGNLSKRVRLLEPHDPKLPFDTLLKFHSVAEALDCLRKSVVDDFHRTRLREILTKLGGQAFNLSDDEVLYRLASYVVSGALRIAVPGAKVEPARASGGGSGMVGRTAARREIRQPPLRAEPPAPRPVVRKQLTWVEIELLDTAGKPVPGTRYRIELPDGQFQEGYLDETGRARADEIEPGTCWITFPDYDKEAIRPR